jgi:hypothetical protein
MTILFGVRRDERTGGADLTVAAARSLASEGLVAYRIHAAPAGLAERREKRANERRRSRLRSAKLLDSNNRFLCECLVHDRSSGGLRVKLMKNVGLPSRCRLYDDETSEVRAVVAAWRRNCLLGMRYCGVEGAIVLPPDARAALAGRYYAISD